MGRVVFGAWIPRSYLHVYEIKSKIESLPFKAEKIKLEKGISFEFEFEGEKFLFHLDGSGLYTLESKKGVSKENIKVFGEKSYNLLLEQIISKCHSVTYKQIKDGSVPLSWCIVNVGGGQVLFKDVKPYEVGVVYNVKYCSKTALYSFMQLLLFNQFAYSLMDKMEFS